jgi:acyl-coenzyme A synthetase/AMP-(fatty) acid ligase
MARKKIGSVGVPIPGGSVEISKPDSNGIGEILYSGPNVCLGYAVSIQDLASSDELLGKLFTGDLGRLDEDGYIFLNGRSKRFVKLAGTSVGMDSMENAIKENLNLDVAVVGRDDKLVIVVQRAYDIDTAAQILELIDASTNLMKVEFVDELPRLDTGKLDYQFLSASYV